MAHDRDTGTCGIAFDIVYGNEDNPSATLRAMQYAKFDPDGRINFLRSFGSSSFWVNNPHPFVQINAIGNQTWLASGYSMAYSAAAIEAFLADSLRGRVFAETPALKEPVARILDNLHRYRSSKST